MTRIPDHRDLALEDLAAGEAEYFDRLIDMTLERDAFRSAYLAALESLSRVSAERDEERHRCLRLLDELRALRGQRAA